jgi:hypothetical protein
MHRAAFAFDHAAFFAVKFCHYCFGRHSGNHRLNVVAVSANHIIACFQSHHRTDTDGFLTDIQMTETADFSDSINFGAFLLENSAQNHLVEHFSEQFRLNVFYRGFLGLTAFFMLALRNFWINRISYRCSVVAL